MDTENNENTENNNENTENNNENTEENNDENNDIKPIKKINRCKDIFIAFICIAAVLVIIYCIVIYTVPKKGVFQPMTKCTTCPPNRTCQSATAKGSVCNWCRPFTKGTNTRAAACWYGHKSGNVVPSAWGVKNKKEYNKTHKTHYNEVKRYKIASVNHPVGDGWICVPSYAKCENCTSIVPSKGNSCKNKVNDQAV